MAKLPGDDPVQPRLRSTVTRHLIASAATNWTSAKHCARYSHPMYSSAMRANTGYIMMRLFESPESGPVDDISNTAMGSTGRMGAEWQMVLN